MTSARDKDADRYWMTTRRAAVLGAAKLGGFAALAARLYYLQVVEGERYHLLAEDNRINLRLLAPSRGQIVDRAGEPLAINTQNFRAVLVSEQTPDVQRTLDRLAGIIDMTDADRERILREVRRKRAFVPITVSDNLSWEQVSQIEVHAPDLPGVSIEVGEIRAYPFGEVTSHIVGHVGAVTEAELTGDPVLALPGFRIGKAGIERYHEEMLRGSAGTSQIEVNAVGRMIRELSRQDGEQGRQVELTIDIGLQQYAQERLAQERSASAAIIDIHSGALYALASSPGFDPNLFTSRVPLDVWQALRDDPTDPLVNKAARGQYPPGSTFKMVTALAALEAGVIGDQHTVFCPGHTDLGNHRFHCWKRGGHGTMNIIEAIEQSCDVFFYDIGRRAGIDAIAAMAKRLGLGEKLGLDLPHERPGLMPTRSWKRGHNGEPWVDGDTLNASIGQGFVLTTPLQLAVMTARLVNGGFAVKPHLTRAIGGRPIERPAPAPIDIKPENLKIIVDGMNAVMLGERGTARRAQIDIPGFEMGGKTGTAQVRRITAAQRAQGINIEDLPWHHRHHALFVGYAPIERPRFAVAVVVEHGIGGSRTAAPLARDLLRETQVRDPLRPRQAAATPIAAAAPTAGTE